MSVELFKSFAYGMVDYIARHNNNYADIEGYLNQLLDQVNALAGGSLAVPLGLAQIFDRRGLIGIDSYDFEEGTLSGPDYNLVVAGGAYWSGGQFFARTGTTTLPMVGKETGTYYLNLASSGSPQVSASPDDTTSRQFDWNASTHIISNKALYTGVAVLFDGDDYADMLTSAAKTKTYTKVADRLEEIEQGLDYFAGHYAQDLPHSGLNFKFKGPLADEKSQVRNDSVITETAAGQVALVDNATNYVEVDPATGTVSANTTGFTSGKIPLYQVVTASGAISTVADKRTAAIAGAGGGGGGHTQNTDIGTTSPTFTIDMDAAGSPTGRAGIIVENGNDPNALLEFNRDTDRWQYSEDGGNTWKNLGDVELDLGVQELTKYVAKEDPEKVLETLARGSSVDYEDLDLSAYIDAPQGVQAAVLRVFFWDSAPGPGVNVKFKKKGAAGSPAQAYTAWEDDTDPATIILPLDDDLVCQYFITASGADTANIRVFFLGYLEKVTGVGTQDKPFSQSGIVVGASTTVDNNFTGFLNRGLAHYLKVQETGGLVTGTYDIHLYARDTFLAADLLYQAEGINPGSDYEDWLPFWVQDKDGTRELHLRLINNDTGQAATFTVTIQAEQFD